MIFHRGMAEALNVSHDRLENMSLRELAECAYDAGYIIEVNETGGVGRGLTLRAESDKIQQHE